MEVNSGVAPVFLFFLAIVILYEIIIFIKGQSSKSWRAHPAEVLALGIDTRQDDYIEESKAFIHYEYRYAGRQYQGKKVMYGDLWSSNYDDSFEYIRGIVTGDKITVYVNPKNPRISVFKKGYKGNFFWQIGLLITVLILVIIF
ncbi:DUF3592 domain-containing protein [Marinicella sp. W31]|uniref:DUF3592 domain-containing protein n=1 Tax=Marinicella sp. W31 TaxID=3023713 RepID=UPI0037570FD4